jgi:hypothetical protein
MSQQTNDFNLFDPTGMLKNMRDTSMDAWSKMMIQFVNTEAYSQATASMLDAWLSTSAPFHKSLESAMAHALSNVNMPSREDIISLAERLTNIEMRLDDLEAKLEETQHAQGAPTSRRARKSSSSESQS